jgi:hypothetical protein
MTDPTDFGVPTCRCLACGKELDMAMNSEGKDPPRPGDLTICLTCGHLMAFNAGLELRELNDDEMKDVAGDRRIIHLQDLRVKALSGELEDEAAKAASEAREMAFRTRTIAKMIGPLLKGLGPELQGAVLADLVSMWVAGFVAHGSRAETAKLRRELVEDWVKLVWRLVEPSEREILANIEPENRRPV